MAVTDLTTGIVGERSLTGCEVNKEKSWGELVVTHWTVGSLTSHQSVGENIGGMIVANLAESFLLDYWVSMAHTRRQVSSLTWGYFQRVW
jgi:hypothetical protein